MLNQWMKQKQKMLGLAVLSLLLLFTWALHYLSQQKQKEAINLKPKTATSTTPMDGVLSTDFTEKNELSALEQQQQQMDQLKKEVANLKQKSEENKNQDNKAALIKEINTILAEREAKQAMTPPPLSLIKVAPVSAMETKPALLETMQFHYQPSIHLQKYHHRFNQFISRAVKKVKTSRNYVPAGTFAKVVLLEGRMPMRLSMDKRTPLGF